MKKLGILAAVLAALMLVSLYPMFNPVISPNGPRSDLDIIWYETPGAAWTALVNGEIDILHCPLTKEQKEEAESDPDIQITDCETNTMFEIDLNNNNTIMEYSGKTNPCSINTVRQALAYLVDKDYIISDILEGCGYRIDVPICYPQLEDWGNPAVMTYDWNHNGIIEPEEDNYPYPYDPDMAAELLATMGFSDTDANGYLNYPNDPEWDAAAGIDTTEMPLKICIRSDHPHLLATGRYLYHQLEGDPAVAGDSVLAASPAWALYGKIGGDFDTTDTMWEQPRSVLSPIVMGDRNYHIYTSGGSFGRFPTYLFNLFHTMFWYPYGSNYICSPTCTDKMPKWYTKYCMPDFGSHCENWTWVAALANSLYWFTHTGGLGLYPDEWDDKGNYIPCPDCPEGYPLLYQEIATRADHDFCEKATNEEFEDMLDVLFAYIKDYSKVELTWTSPPASFENYKGVLSHCGSVILVTDPDDDLVEDWVTGFSYCQYKCIPTWVGYSDPKTTLHNNDPNLKEYNESSWADLNVLKMYVIHAKKAWSSDQVLEQVVHAPTRDLVIKATNLALEEVVFQLRKIPLWSSGSFFAWRKEVAGVVAQKGKCIINDYTFLNAYRTDNPGAPLRLGCCESWGRLNILYSQWDCEYAFLDRVYTRLIAENPYDPTVDQPWVAQDWDVDTWIDPRDGCEKTNVTYWFRNDVGCAAPITGEFLGFFDANDYEFTCWYNYAFDTSEHWSNFMHIHHIEVIDCRAVRVYFDDKSVWFPYAPTYPLLGPKKILIDQLCTEECETFTGADLDLAVPPYGEYQFTSDQVINVINATCNGLPIQEGVDYYIRAGYEYGGAPLWCHNVFVPMRAFAPTDVIKICYWTPADSADGAFMGGAMGYDWTDTMYAYGTHYPVAITSATAALNKNPYFFLETPLLGETDWRWHYIGTEKPRKGNYKIDILDVVKCTAAYSTRGDGPYDPYYNPCADIDGSDLCHVGILDLVAITGKYGQTWGGKPATTIGVVGGTIDLENTDPAVYVVENPDPYMFEDHVEPIRHSYEAIITDSISHIRVYPWCWSTRDTVTIITHWGTATLTLGSNYIDIVKTSRTYCVNIYWHKSDCTWEILHINMGQVDP